MITLESQRNYIRCFRTNSPVKSKKNEYSTLHHKVHYSSFFKRLDEYKIIKLQPGLILIKNGISTSNQIKIAKMALEMGSDDNHGFWKTNEQGEKVLNQTPHRGRIFNSLESFPRIFSDLCMDSLLEGAKVDTTLRPIEPTHLLLLFYKTLQEVPKRGYIGWHQDNDPNDGEEEMPVVSFTIGDSCDFLVKNEKPKISQDSSLSNPENLNHRILFESGDVLIFGGPSRYIHHAIYQIYQKSAPQFLPFQDGRLNFTFRYAPKILGKEEAFSSKNFKSIYNKS